MQNRQLNWTVASVMIVALIAGASFATLVALPPSLTYDALPATWMAQQQGERNTAHPGEPG